MPDPILRARDLESIGVTRPSAMTSYNDHWRVNDRPTKPVPDYRDLIAAVRRLEVAQSALALYKDEPAYQFLDHAIKYLLDQADCVMRGKPLPEYA